MATKKSSQTEKSIGSEESNSTPGALKGMEISNKQKDYSMPGDNANYGRSTEDCGCMGATGRSEEASGSMPEGKMSSDSAEESGSNMPGGGMSNDKTEEPAGGMPGGGMSGNGGGDRSASRNRRPARRQTTARPAG